MKSYLLPAGGKFYKANLHCHTTVSDGKMTPEETKKLYKEHGYAVVAFTDHEVCVNHSDLTDRDFLAMNGVEVDVNAEGYGHHRFMPTYHICFLAKREGQDTIPCFTRGYNDWLLHTPSAMNEQKCIGPDDYERRYEKVQEVVDAYKAAGFYATLNHPTWSIQDTQDYLHVKGFDAMEIFNSGCYYGGYDEINTHEYDAMLRRGHKLAAVAADDNHATFPITDGRCDLMRSWVMIKADRLDYPAVVAALEAGNFYASNGPKITELSVEDGFVNVKCSPAAKITYTTFGRRCRAAYPEGVEKTLTSARFEIQPTDIYFRITVSDGREHYAWSRAYFLEDVFGIPMPDYAKFRD